MTLSEEDAAQAAKRFKELAAPTMRSNLHFNRVFDDSMRRMIRDQASISGATDKLIRDWAKAASVETALGAALKESMRPLLESKVAMQASADLFSKALDSFRIQVPDLLTTNSGIVQDILNQREAAESLSRLASQVPRFELPEVRVSDFLPALEPLREAAEKSAQEIRSGEIGELVGMLREAQDAALESDEDRSPEEAKPSDKTNTVLLVAILGVVVDVLADQRDILEMAFLDASALGHALAGVWEYVVAVLFVIAIGVWRDRQ